MPCRTSDTSLPLPARVDVPADLPIPDVGELCELTDVHGRPDVLSVLSRVGESPQVIREVPATGT